MSDDKTVWYDYLLSKYPLIFKHLTYVECDKGWSSLIDSTCSVLEYHIKNYIPSDIKDDVYATTIKSKFGGLRFYMSHETPFITGAIALAEELSCVTCESCGSKGSQRSINNWVTVCCEPCFEKAKIKLGK